MARVLTAAGAVAAVDRARLRALQRAGVLSGFAAGAWLGAAEAPTKLVTLGLSPVLISFVMVMGVFLARWSLPALVQGTSAIGFDVRKAPHLVIWAVLAGCLWAVANTLTVFAIRDIGLSIAFPLWNSNSLLGVLWGVLLFRELRNASRTRWLAVVGGALLMVVGATALAFASAESGPSRNAMTGVIAALTAGLLWGTMYIPYRKAYLTGMSPLSFITFFSVGEVITMIVLALWDSQGVGRLVADVGQARGVIFWIMLGGFVWVIGDLFQQYAAKYVGISRGIPLSNTNQLWGLVWGVFVFGELAQGGALLQRVALGSIVMALGAAAIALASASPDEHAQWRRAAHGEARRYHVDEEYVSARMAGKEATAAVRRRTPLDYGIALVATAVFVAAALVAESPRLELNPLPALLVIGASLLLLLAAGLVLWRTTRFV